MTCKRYPGGDAASNSCKGAANMRRLNSKRNKQMATATTKVRAQGNETAQAAKILAEHLQQFSPEKQTELLEKLDCRLAKSHASVSKAG